MACCTCHMHMHAQPHAHACTATCHMPHATCHMHMHMPHATCTCACACHAHTCASRASQAYMTDGLLSGVVAERSSSAIQAPVSHEAETSEVRRPSATVGRATAECETGVGGR
eukprot:1913036-Prymnesium_polylepis.1